LQYMWLLGSPSVNLMPTRFGGE